MKKTEKYIFFKILLILLFSVLLIWLSYFTQRSNFNQLIVLYSALFVVYFFLIKLFSDTRQIIFVGIFFRLLLLFSIPNLSDDFYRFVWDGRLLANGINPYTILPADFLQSPDFQKVIFDESLFSNLNSPHYYSVYPPLNQMIFGLSAWFSNGNLFQNVVWMRVFILIGEVLSLFLLQTIKPYRFKTHSGTALRFGECYIFNPLIIIELTGNLHFEALVICFLVMAYWLFQRNLLKLSAISFACAVATKMLPLIFIPLIIKHLGIKKGIIYSLIVGLIVVLFFLPFIDNLLISKIFSSVNLYFQKFEFNASIYYLIREIGFQIFGYNIIQTAGKYLALLTFGSILWFSWKSKDFFLDALLILSIYLAFATTVHPWYVCTLVFISIFTPFRFPIIWSFFVFLSYFTYKTTAYQENLWLVSIEYLAVYCFAFYEFRNLRKQYQKVNNRSNQ